MKKLLLYSTVVLFAACSSGSKTSDVASQKVQEAAKSQATPSVLAEKTKENVVVNQVPKEEVKGEAAVVSSGPVADLPPKTEVEKKVDEVKEKAKEAVAAVTVAATPAPASSPTAEVKQETKHEAKVAHAPVKGVEPEKALGWLKNGNTRYLKNKLRGDGQSIKDRERLYAGQKPHTIVLSCSDSRVPPELIFDQKLGEIFVIRVAGEALDSSVIASIEYAVEHLGTRLILVMGHTKCGAVAAALGSKPGESVGSGDLDKLVADIKPRLGSVTKESQSKDLVKESSDNASGIAKDLIARSKIIAEKVEKGDIKVKASVYDIKTGMVDFFN